MAEHPEDIYLALREIWPGVSIKEFNEDFTMDQVFVLLLRQGPFTEEVRLRSTQGEDGAVSGGRVSGDEFLGFWGAN